MDTIVTHSLTSLTFALATLPEWLMQGVYVACAVLLLAHGFANWREERTARRWPATEGVVREIHASTGPADRRLPHPLGDITYAYDVAGHCYLSHRIAFYSVTWERYRRMLDYVAMLTPGSRVTVYYDPAHPGQAVLDRRTSAWDALIFIGCALAMLAFRPVVFSFRPQY